MRFLPLFWSGICRKPGRTALIGSAHRTQPLELSCRAAAGRFARANQVSTRREARSPRGHLRSHLSTTHAGTRGCRDQSRQGLAVSLYFHDSVRIPRSLSEVAHRNPGQAIGATLGAVNSLYAIVDSRRRELGTLRAIGFGSGAVIASILCESLLFAVPGALLGGALAWMFFNGLSASPFGYSSAGGSTAGRDSTPLTTPSRRRLN
jgi:FtsX-like permease family protein